MDISRIGRKAMIGGLVLVAAGALPGCSGMSKALKTSGGGMSLAGKVSGVEGLSTAGGWAGVAGILVEFGGMASYEMPKYKGLTFDNFVYVGDRSEFPVNEQGFLDGDFDGRKKLGDIRKEIDYSGDFVVVFNTERYKGQFLEASISVGEVVKKGLFGKKEYGNFEPVTIIRHDIGEDENYVVWEPFKKGVKIGRPYMVHGIVTGENSANCIGACTWKFDD